MNGKNAQRNLTYCIQLFEIIMKFMETDEGLLYLHINAHFFVMFELSFNVKSFFRQIL